MASLIRGEQDGTGYESFINSKYQSFIEANKIEMAPAVNRRPWLDWYLDAEMANGRSVFVGLFGRSQSGKSTLAIQTAIKHDPNFSWDRVTYDGGRFLKQAMMEPPAGSYFIIDDAGAQMPASRWWDIKSQVFDFAQQVLGMYHWCVFVTVPLDRDIIAKVRNRFDIFIRLDQWSKGEGIVRLPIASRNLSHPNTLFPHPKFRDSNGMLRHLMRIKFDPLPTPIFNYYQERKKRPEIMNYMQSWYNQYQEAERKMPGKKRELTEKQKENLKKHQFKHKPFIELDPSKPLAAALHEYDQH